MREQPANGRLADAQGPGDYALVSSFDGSADVPNVVQATQLAACAGTAGIGNGNGNGNGVLGADDCYVQTSLYI
ncbi:hypothetical protein [Paenarthrobacter sp. AMU7]|uniref:Uncharacterized protein n=1 Tax=Paenarthrobacter sp. AMU7 TaxID=3162492 RepID=A0AB39YP44_9MICC